MAFITDRGLRTPTWIDIYSSLAQHWKTLTGKELRDNKPEGQFMKAIAEHLSNKGFTEQDVEALWPNLEDVFWNGFITTAGDVGMDYLVKLRLASGRRGPKKATGTAWAEGTPGTTVPARALTLIAPDKTTTFTNTRDFTISSSGLAYFPIEANQAGPQGNVAAGALTATDLPTVITAVSTTERTEYAFTGEPPDTTVILPDDQFTTRYQVITPVADILDEIVIRVSGAAGVFEIGLALYDHSTSDLIVKAPVQRKFFDGQEPQDVAFSFNQFDLYDHVQVRVVPILLDGQVSLAARSTGGGWHENHMDTGKALWTKITYGGGGKTSGGREKESTTELRRRHWDGLYSPGWGNPESIRSKLMDVSGVMFARVEVNDTMSEKSMDTYGNPLGITMPAKSIAVVVWGGDPDAIAQVLYQTTPAGTELLGNTTVMVNGTNGQLIPVRYYRPAAKPIYVHVLAYPTSMFPYNGVTLIKDVIISYIGGVDSHGVEHSGSPPGQPLFLAPAIQAIKNAIPTVWDLELTWGSDAGSLTEDSLPIGFLEKPFTTTENITITLGRLPRS